MNPIRMLKIYRRASRLGDLFEEAAVSKSLFKSYIFWTQVVSAALELNAVLPLPPGYTALGGQVLTIALRLLRSNGPVHVVTPK
jgi:hypothetical protein